MVDVIKKEEYIPAPSIQEIREKIMRLQEEAAKFPGVEFGDSTRCPLTHSFAPGVYVRQIKIPAGTVIIGKIHKHAHPNFLLEGKVSVFTESGGVEELEAPLQMISPAGTKRIVFAHTDTVWTTIHATTETDLEKIEEVTIADSFESYELFRRSQKCLGG